MEDARKSSNAWLGTVIAVVMLVILAAVLGFAFGAFDPSSVERIHMP